ncbi:hypothetical protein HYQ44_019247 [Verticillium longisporum]|nr:hypothetical protein HYQ44_019247 [Verticillium longisporum]
MRSTADSMIRYHLNEVLDKNLGSSAEYDARCVLRLVSPHVGVRPKLVPDPAAGAGVRRGHMPISRGALGDAHEAAGLPGVDHHGAYGRDLHRVDAGLPPAGRGYSVRVPPCMALG